MKLPQEETLKILKLEDLKKNAKYNAKRQRDKRRKGLNITVKPETWQKLVDDYDEEIQTIKSKYE